MKTSNAKLRNQIIQTKIVPRLDPDFTYDLKSIFNQCYLYQDNPTGGEYIYLCVSDQEFFRVVEEFVLNPLNPNRDNQ